MAIVRTAGTEIIRTAHFEDIDDTREVLIFGVQHHIYTVLSVIAACTNLQTSTNSCYLSILGYDAKATTSQSGQLVRIFGQNVAAGSTFVWNDKFSFNGYEPTGTPSLNAAGQIAIAAQAGSVAQQLSFVVTSVVDDFDVFVTYIDQDNT